MDCENETTEWDAICRICLQEGEMHSIFDSSLMTNDYEYDVEITTIAKKIMLCSPIEVSVKHTHGVCHEYTHTCHVNIMK